MTDPQKLHRLLDNYYQYITVLTDRIYDQKQTAVYAESLGADISYMADRELRTTMMTLWGMLLATDTLRVAMGYSAKHRNDLQELTEELNRL